MKNTQSQEWAECVHTGKKLIYACLYYDNGILYSQEMKENCIHLQFPFPMMVLGMFSFSDQNESVKALCKL